MKPLINEAIRKQAEKCDSLVSLIKTNSITGGVGSSHVSNFSQIPKVDVVNFSIWSNEGNMSSIEAYNSSFSISNTLTNQDTI